MNPNQMKVLFIRFSSIGDVLQSLSIPAKINEIYPNAEIHWLTRSDFVDLGRQCPEIQKIWSIDRKASISELYLLAKTLKSENFTHLYDAHNSMRSRIICWILNPFYMINQIRKPRKVFKRILLFQFRWNLFQKPFSGQRDLLEPLKKWNITSVLPPAPIINIDENVYTKISLRFPDLNTRIALAPSAAHALKRWPIEHWQKLIDLLPNKKFFILGGPEDHFLNQIQSDRCIHLHGHLNIPESGAAITLSEGLVSNDTWALHWAEQTGKNAIALMGPAPFGFPSRKSTQILEVQLPCRPCSKHGQKPCTNIIHQECMVSIRPEMVAQKVQGWLS